MIDGFIERLEDFIKEWESKVRPNFERDFENLEFEPLGYTKGRKYVKIVQENRVVAFVDMNTGDIFKPAGWKAPAKHARGNIYKDRGAEALSEHGSVRYLR